MTKVAPLPYDDRTVYSVASFNQGVAQWLGRLPTVWVEGEVTELRRHQRWASVFFTLKDPADGSCLPAAMPRGTFDALDLGLAEGERVHVYGRPELLPRRGELRLRVLTVERFGLGAHLAGLERLKRALAAEGLFAAERKRALPRLPRRIGVVTGNEAAAKGDIVASIQARFPPARLLIAETLVQGARAPGGIAAARRSNSARLFGPGTSVTSLRSCGMSMMSIDIVCRSGATESPRAGCRRLGVTDHVDHAEPGLALEPVREVQAQPP